MLLALLSTRTVLDLYVTIRGESESSLHLRYAQGRFC